MGFRGEQVSAEGGYADAGEDSNPSDEKERSGVEKK